MLEGAVQFLYLDQSCEDIPNALLQMAEATEQTAALAEEDLY